VLLPALPYRKSPAKEVSLITSRQALFPLGAFDFCTVKSVGSNLRRRREQVEDSFANECCRQLEATK